MSDLPTIIFTFVVIGLVWNWSLNSTKLVGTLNQFDYKRLVKINHIFFAIQLGMLGLSQFREILLFAVAIVSPCAFVAYSIMISRKESSFWTVPRNKFAGCTIAIVLSAALFYSGATNPFTPTIFAIMTHFQCRLLIHRIISNLTLDFQSIQQKVASLEAEGKNHQFYLSSRDFNDNTRKAS